MDKSRHLGETRRVPRLNPDDADRLLIDYLEKKLQDPGGLHSHYGELIPTVDVFSVDPDTIIRVETPQQRDVWYFFSPIERTGRSPSDLWVGDGVWTESSPREDIVDEQGHKIMERRTLRYLHWTMHELRLVDSQHAQTSSTAEKAVKNNPSNDQDSAKVDKLTSLSSFDTNAFIKKENESSQCNNYVLSKVFAEEAAKKQKQDEPVIGGIIEEGSTATRGQVGPLTSSLSIPPDDRLDWKDPAEDYEAQLVTEPSAMGSPAAAGPSCSTNTTDSRPGSSSGSTSEESSTLSFTEPEDNGFSQ